MKRKALITCILGMLILSSIILPSVVSSIKTNENVNQETEKDISRGIQNPADNRTAFLGEVWSINQENSFGFADLNIKSDVYVDWSTHSNALELDEGSGYLQMMFANLFTNRSGQEFSNFRLSTYKMKVYDGPSTDDNLLFEEKKEILENAGDWIEELKFPITIDPQGQSVRDIAVECIAETKLISNLLKIPLQGTHGIRNGICNLHINFDSQTTVMKSQCSSSSENKVTFNRSEIELNLGDIQLMTSNRSGEAVVNTNDLANTYEVTLNRSESPYEFMVNVGYGISLDKIPTPDFLSRILGSKAEFMLEGSSYNRSSNNRTKSILSDSDVVVLTAETLNRTGSFNRSFVIKGTPSELIFLVSCDLSYDKIKSWKFSLPGENLFDSELCRVKLNYI